MVNVLKAKRIFIAIVMCLISFNLAKAQFAKNNALYATTELNLGNYWGLDLNLNYVLKEKYSFRLGYTGTIRKAKSQPNDFSTGLIGIFNFGLNRPFDQFENFGASIGRIYKLNKEGNIRVNCSLGAGYTIYTEPENWKKTGNLSWTENYSYDKVKHQRLSLIISPKIEFPVTKYWGMIISPALQINKDRVYFGIGLGNMIGLLR